MNERKVVRGLLMCRHVGGGVRCYRQLLLPLLSWWLLRLRFDAHIIPLRLTERATNAKGTKPNEQTGDIPQKDLPEASTRSSNKKSRASGWLQDFHL